VCFQGLWTETQIEPLKRIVNFVHAHGTKIGIQLAHAGRKASTHAPWVQWKLPKGISEIANTDENGWPDKGMQSISRIIHVLTSARVVAPSAIPFHERSYPHPKALTKAQILEIEDAFVAAVERCKAIGC